MTTIKQLLVFGFILLSLPSLAQKERKDIRSGNRLFKSEKFDESEVSYRKAIDHENNSIPGSFNLGDALYKQEKFEDAGVQFNQVIDNNVDKNIKSKAFHNLGNSLLQAGELEDAIEAYKNSLRNVPDDMETKYNLAYAQNLLKKQEQQQEQNKDQNKDNEDKKDQEKQDQKDKQDQNKDQEQQQDKDQQQDQKQQDQKDQQDQEQKQQQPQEGKISKEDAQRLLEALANDEKDVQDRVKKEKAKAKRVRVLKDW